VLVNNYQGTKQKVSSLAGEQLLKRLVRVKRDLATGLKRIMPALPLNSFCAFYLTGVFEWRMRCDRLNGRKQAALAMLFAHFFCVALDNVSESRQSVMKHGEPLKNTEAL